MQVKQKDPLKTWRILLVPFSLLFALVVWARNALIDFKIIRSVHFSIPTIGIGNLVVGGTGKTPHVEYLIRLLEPFINVAVLSRGYSRKTIGFREVTMKTTARESGDEPQLLKYKFPPVPVFVGENRGLAIPQLLHKYPAVQSVIMDDVFQHRSVTPYLNILLTEYGLPYFNDFLLPAGALREPTSGAKRADCIIVTKCPPILDSATELDYRRKINALPHQEVFFSTFTYGRPYRLFNPIDRPELNADTDIILISGIAGTDYLLQYLQSNATQIHSLEFGDHHDFTNEEMGALKTAYDALDAPKKIIITTEKDAVRLSRHREFITTNNLPIYNLPIEVRFTGSNGGQFNNYIRHKLLEFQS